MEKKRIPGVRLKYWTELARKYHGNEQQDFQLEQHQLQIQALESQFLQLQKTKVKEEAEGGGGEEEEEAAEEEDQEGKEESKN